MWSGGLSGSLHLRTHVEWVHNLLLGTMHTRANNPARLKLCMSRWVLWALAWYRLGSHDLNGFKLQEGLASHPQRDGLCVVLLWKQVCPGMAHVYGAKMWRNSAEDLRHFLSECPA
jgi:hypothetical protein